MNRYLVRSLSSAVNTQKLLNRPNITASLPCFSKFESVSQQRTVSLNIPVSRNFSTDSVHDKIDGFVKEAKVVVFMKGVPAAPQCGFSNAVVQILRW